MIEDKRTEAIKSFKNNISELEIKFESIKDWFTPREQAKVKRLIKELKRI